MTINLAEHFVASTDPKEDNSIKPRDVSDKHNNGQTNDSLQRGHFAGVDACRA